MNSFSTPFETKYNKLLFSGLITAKIDALPGLDIGPFGRPCFK